MQLRDAKVVALVVQKEAAGLQLRDARWWCGSVGRPARCQHDRQMRVGNSSPRLLFAASLRFGISRWSPAPALARRLICAWPQLCRTLLQEQYPCAPMHSHAFHSCGFGSWGRFNLGPDQIAVSYVTSPGRMRSPQSY